MDLEHFFKVEEGITLEISVEDEELEDVAVVDGIVDVKEEHRRKIDLAYNAIHVASMDIIQLNVHEQPALPAVVQLPKASTSKVTSHKHMEDHVERVEDQEETDEVMVAGELVFRVSKWYTMLKDTDIRSMKMVISSLILKMMPLPRSKIIKIRKTERNQHRSCLWVCGSILSIKCWFFGFIK